MAPDFEIPREIEIMRMISFFFCLPYLMLSAIGTPELRIAAPAGWGMTLIQKSRMRIAPEIRIVSPCAWLRCSFEDYIQLNSSRIMPGWRNTKPSQDQGIRLNIYIYIYIRCVEILRGIQQLRYLWISSESILLNGIIPYSIPHEPGSVCTILH